jgi:hypothetical protein
MPGHLSFRHYKSNSINRKLFARFLSINAIVMAITFSKCAERVFENPVDTSVALEALANLVIQALADTAVDIGWTYVGRRVDAFELERDVDGTFYQSVTSLNASARQYRDRIRLILGQSYHYRVRGSNSENHTVFAEGSPLRS